MSTVLLYIVSYHGDMWKECEMLHKMVLPDLRTWCENKRIQLITRDIRWGGPVLKESLLASQQLIQEAYYNGQMPIFINLTCETFGLVPMWGEAPDDIITDIHKKLHLTSEQLDLLYGAYREDNPNAIFLVRSGQSLEKLGSEENKHFIKKHLLLSSQHEICAKCLDKYPEQRVFRYSYDKVNVDQEKKTIEVDLNQSVFEKVIKYLQQCIQGEGQGRDGENDVLDEACYRQEAVIIELGTKARGCDEVVEKLEHYIRTGGKDVPLLLLGGAGTGKSSILAKAVYQFSRLKYLDKYLSQNQTDNWLLFYLFVGAMPRSTELSLMLKRLLKLLNITMESSLLQDVDALAQMCYTALSGSTDQHLVLIIDAVDMFDDEPAAQIMSWVPRKLGPNVRCILSMETDSIQHQKLMSCESKPEELYLEPLHFDARKKIVSELLSRYNRSLTRDQMNWLLAKKGSDNPLWLSLAAEELCILQNCCDFDRCIIEIPEELQDLLDIVLERLERNHGDLLVACLCLLEVSACGLLESELRTLLGKVHEQVMPSPFEEKEETESSEKELGKLNKGLQPLEGQRWLEIYSALRPYLRPYVNYKDGLLHFSHGAFGRAVRARYFKTGRENENADQDVCKHWHHQLADYFEHCTEINRKAEEYLYHLCQIDDTYRLCQALCDWSILEKLYDDVYSSQLLNYWRKAGGRDQMISCYSEALTELESIQPRDDELIAARYELIAQIYLQAGKYTESLELAKTVMKWEEKELGNRPERMVELNSLLAEIYEEKLKLNDFVSPAQLPDLRKTIMYARKSIELRKALTGDHHKLKLALTLMKLAFSLESWSACGGIEMEMTGEEAILEGNKHIDEALSIFEELKDAGHYAEALMTKGVLASRGSMEQLKFYNKAMEICHQVYGEESLLSSRLYINIGIVYEDNNDYVKAYEYFKKWADTSEAVLGPDHPKTIRARGVLREPRYRLVALRLKQCSEANNRADDVNTVDIDEMRINQEVEGLDEEEDGYQSYSVDGDEDEEEDIEQREDIDDTNNIQQLINATNIMQGIFNDIWHHLNIDGAEEDDDDDGDHPDGSQVTMSPSDVVNHDAPTSQVVLSEPLVEFRSGTSSPNGALRMLDSNILSEYEGGDNRLTDGPLEAVIAHFMHSASIQTSSEPEIDNNHVSGDISDENTSPSDTVSHSYDNNSTTHESSVHVPDHESNSVSVVTTQGDSNMIFYREMQTNNATTESTAAEQDLNHDNRNV